MAKRPSDPSDVCGINSGLVTRVTSATIVVTGNLRAAACSAHSFFGFKQERERTCSSANNLVSDVCQTDSPCPDAALALEVHPCRA